MKSTFIYLLILLGVCMSILLFKYSQEIGIEPKRDTQMQLENTKYQSDTKDKLSNYTINRQAPLNTWSDSDTIDSIYENKLDKRVIHETIQNLVSGDTMGWNSFRHFSEPFKSNIVLTDVETNKTYDLPANHELYYENGEIKMGKYDDTNYAGFIENIQRKREQLEKEVPAKCNDTIKCIADFDTRIGGKLCCGQKGRLKDTRYVCPENKPTCGNFKCGTNFGECS